MFSISASRSAGAVQVQAIQWGARSNTASFLKKTLAPSGLPAQFATRCRFTLPGPDGLSFRPILVSHLRKEKTMKSPEFLFLLTRRWPSGSLTIASLKLRSLLLLLWAELALVLPFPRNKYLACLLSPKAPTEVFYSAVSLRP